MKKRFNDLFWGIALIAIALGILAVAFGFIQTPTSRMVWTVLIGLVALASLIKMNWFGFFFIAAVGLHINAEQLGIQSVWVLYLAALLFSIGFQMIFFKVFRKGPRIIINSDKEKFDKEINFDFNEYKKYKSSSSDMSSDHIAIENNFSEQAKYIQSINLTSANIENNFGGLRVYFDQAQFNSDGCTVQVENNFGECTLYFPSNVSIDNRLESFLGSASDTGHYSNNANLGKVVITGESNFGNIKIVIV